MPNVYTQFIGIDVSKSKLDIYETKNKKYSSVSNDKKGIDSLVKLFKPSDDILVLIDLTGGYQALVADAFYKEGFCVHKARDNDLKHFARSFDQIFWSKCQNRQNRRQDANCLWSKNARNFKTPSDF